MYMRHVSRVTSHVNNFTSMNILISGSLAYDYIMDFPDSFRNHILPDKVHMINLSFVIPELRKGFGGCAGNMAYNIKLLGGKPLILAPLGEDGADYLKHLKKLKISAAYIPRAENHLTSSAHITTDKDDNQIAAFHVGAGFEADQLSVHKVKEKIKLALIAPTKKEAMIRHSKECAERQIPIVFDPGQQLTALSAQELMLMIGQAQILIANDYEMSLVEKKTGWDMAELLTHTQVVITTLGEKGSVIRTRDEIFEIKPCPPRSVDDPTGAGDAYRAGFFTAYVKGLNLQTCGQVGSVAATYAVEHYGTQNHRFTWTEFAKRYEEAYGEKLTFDS